MLHLDRAGGVRLTDGSTGSAEVQGHRLNGDLAATDHEGVGAERDAFGLPGHVADLTVDVLDPRLAATTR